MKNNSYFQLAAVNQPPSIELNKAKNECFKAKNECFKANQKLNEYLHKTIYYSISNIKFGT
jgi:hypothetical protein